MKEKILTVNNCPTISVIMGAYNCEETIERAIQSIQDQTYRNWELIVCDDCSTDSTYEILNRLAKEDKRIHVLHNEINLRLAATLNRCLSASKGEYIARMDGDDISLPERFEKQLEFLSNNNEYAVVGSSIIVFDDVHDNYIRVNDEYPTSKVLLKHVPFWHPTIMMRKSAYELLSGYNAEERTMRAEDVDIWFRFFEKGLNGYNILEPLYMYHEDLNDYKKRSIKAGIETAKVYFQGYRMLNFPCYTYVYSLRPIITALTPNAIMKIFHMAGNKRIKE